MIDDPPSHLCQKLSPPPQTYKVTYLLYTHPRHIRIPGSSQTPRQPKDNQSFSSVPVVTETPTSQPADLSRTHTFTITPTETFTSRQQVWIRKEWETEWMDRRTRRREVENEECRMDTGQQITLPINLPPGYAWWKLSKLSPSTLSNPPTVCQQRAGKRGGQTSRKIKCCWEERGEEGCRKRGEKLGGQDREKVCVCVCVCVCARCEDGKRHSYTVKKKKTVREGLHWGMHRISSHFRFSSFWHTHTTRLLGGMTGWRAVTLNMWHLPITEQHSHSGQTQRLLN